MRTSRKRKRIRLGVAAATVVGGSTFADVAPVHSYAAHGCYWGSPAVKVHVSGSAPGYTVLAQNALSEWNSRTAKLNFAAQSTSTGRQFRLRDVDAGNIGWDGIVRKPGTTSTIPTCITNGGGAFANDALEAVFNRWSVSTANAYNWVYSNPVIQTIFVHEVGHALGLLHSDGQTTCTVGTFPDVYAIMHWNTVRSLGACGKFVPQADDISGANAIYPSGGGK